MEIEEKSGFIIYRDSSSENVRSFIAGMAAITPLLDKQLEKNAPNIINHGAVCEWIKY